MKANYHLMLTKLGYLPNEQFNYQYGNQFHKYYTNGIITVEVMIWKEGQILLVDNERIALIENEKL